MRSFYQEDPPLTIDDVISVTEQYVTAYPEQFNEEDIERYLHLRETENLTKVKQDRIATCVRKIDKKLIFSDLKVSTILAMINVILLNQNNINRINNDQLISFSCYLTEKPLKDYQRTTRILGTKIILDPLFRRTVNFFQQRSIFQYIDDMSETEVKDVQNREELLEFQNNVRDFLSTHTLEEVLEKTNYDHELKGVQESLNKIL